MKHYVYVILQIVYFASACTVPEIVNATLSIAERKVTIGTDIAITCESGFYIDGGTKTAATIFCLLSGGFSTDKSDTTSSAVPKCIESRFMIISSLHLYIDCTTMAITIGLKWHYLTKSYLQYADWIMQKALIQWTNVKMWSINSLLTPFSLWPIANDLCFHISPAFIIVFILVEELQQHKSHLVQLNFETWKALKGVTRHRSTNILNNCRFFPSSYTKQNAKVTYTWLDHVY